MFELLVTVNNLKQYITFITGYCLRLLISKIKDT